MDKPDAAPEVPEVEELSVEDRLERALVDKQKESEEPEDGETEETEVVDDEPPAEVEEELFELEVEGKRAQVPKEFKDSFLRQADYTRKTMELADQRRNLSEERKIFDLERQVESSIAEKDIELRSLVSQSKQYEAVMQQAVNTGDAETLARYNTAYMLLQRQVQEKSGELQTEKQNQAQLLQYAASQRRQRADEEASKRIPGFSHEIKLEMVKVAKKAGFHEAEIAEVDDVRTYEVLWKAAQWDKLQSSKPHVTKKVADAPKTLTPKGQPPKDTKVSDLRTKLKKTGRSDYMEMALERRLSGKK